MVKVGINGFGRIGRAYLRLASVDPDIEVVAINDTKELETMSYMLKYDSVYETKENISYDDDNLILDNKKIKKFSSRDIGGIDWGKADVDVVIEATGVFTNYEDAYKHIKQGAKKVIITAPAKGEIEDIPYGQCIVGVDDDLNKNIISSNASCTTNAVAIAINALNKKIGVESAVLSTIHAYTASQPVVDSSSKKSGDLRIGRSAGSNIIPTATGAAKAVTRSIKDLENKFDGISFRVPISCGSLVDLTFISKKDTDVDEINNVLSNIEHKLFLATYEQLVSTDIVGTKYVSIADLSLTKVINKNLVKVLLWYDNEMGYASSLIEHTKDIC